MDFKDLKANNNIEDIIGGYVTLKKQGRELIGICPFHDDRKGSLTVYEKGGEEKFKCHSCGEGGDVIDFLLAMGKTHKEAVEELSGGGAIQASPKRNKTPEKKRVVWTQIAPEAPPTSFAHYRLGEPADKTLYKNPDGTPFGYVLRFETPEGKQTLPFIFATDGTRKEWRFQGFSTPRPLLGIDLATQNPNATILLVEGEKCAKHAQKYFDPAKLVVVSWVGGANGIGASDFSLLKGRKAILWPDNDASGMSAMLHILHVVELKAKILPLEESLPKGWDCADKEWSAEEITAYIKSKIQDPPALNQLYTVKEIGRDTVYDIGMVEGRWKMTKREADESPAPTTTPKAPPLPEHEPVHDEAEEADQAPFRFCGYDKNESGGQSFYFYVYRSNQIVRLSPSSMATKANLMTLAPLNWWEEMFPAAKGGINTDAATNYLIECSIKARIFNPDNARGRGCWIDGKDVIMHLGEGLIVNGHGVPFAEYRSKYHYEAANDLGITLGIPATNPQSAKFLELCNFLNWERPIFGHLLAGWCAIAPFCGALSWRPHIWITGGAGSGKSWIFNNIVRKMLGNTVLSVQSSSTSAGIRQWMGSDALPVMFDEAEGETKSDQMRMQDVLNLMRGSSATDGGDIIKGSAGGGATKYKTRSCMVFASIGVQLSQESDKSRVSVLSATKHPDPTNKSAHFKELQKLLHETMAGGFPERLQSRTISILPNILRNAETFATAAATVLGDQRAGDQIGTLLAGAYSLVSTKAISYDEALAWIEKQDWSEENSKTEDADEVRLINYLMEKISIIEIGGMKLERTLGELVKIATEPALYSENDITPDMASERLGRLGYRVDTTMEHLVVSNTAEPIKNALKDTPWAKNHSNILKRLNGAQPVQSTTFGAHTKSRAVSIPLDTIFG